MFAASGNLSSAFRRRLAPFSPFFAVGRWAGLADVFRAWDGSPVFPPMDPTRATEALRSFDFDLLLPLCPQRADGRRGSAPSGDPGKIALLYDLGARYAQMSGSGSTVYGVFNRPGEARQAARMLGKNAIVAETLP